MTQFLYFRVMVAGIILALASLPGCGMMSERKAMGNPDDMFVMMMARSSTAEAQVSEMAAKRASNSEVKQFAQTSASDHMRMNQELEQLAEQKGLTVSMTPDEMHRDMAAHLQALSGEQFDREYVAAMVADHAKMVSKFESKAKMAQDPRVRQWAASKVPALREHLKMAQQLQQDMMMSNDGRR